MWCVGDFVRQTAVTKAGGALGIVTAFIAYYCGLAEMLTSEDMFVIPIGRFPPKNRQL